MDGVEAAEEGAVGDDTAEGGAGGGGAPYIGEGGQAEEDIREEVVVEAPKRGRRHRGVDTLGAGLFRRGHRVFASPPAFRGPWAAVDRWDGELSHSSSCCSPLTLS